MWWFEEAKRATAFPRNYPFLISGIKKFRPLHYEEWHIFCFTVWTSESLKLLVLGLDFVSMKGINVFYQS